MEKNNFNKTIIAKKGLVLLVVANFILGFIGGLTALIIMAQSGKLSAVLGIKNLSSTSPEKATNQKIVLEESSAITEAVKKVSPAVVSISTTKDIMNFFGQTYQQKGGGTGFIITSDGLIVTNKHVVDDATAEYTVFTTDGKKYTPKILAKDQFADLAILKIDASGLSVADLGDSDGLKVGQWVVAIGNALGEFDNSVTVGVISAKERQIEAGNATGGATEQLSGLLQTDAAINPGNSGGPLVNLAGQVIGVNVAMAGNAQNISFALPINSVKKSIDQVRTLGKIVKPYLGIRYVPITKEVAEMNNLKVDYGVMVVGNQSQLAILPGSPASKAGLRENDIVLKINDQKIDEKHQLVNSIAKYNVGDTIELTVLRNDKELKIKVKLEEYKN